MEPEDDIDLNDIPTDVDSLPRVIEALDAGLGALAAQQEQIWQMKGMFDDRDGSIQDALDDATHAEGFLKNARTFLSNPPDVACRLDEPTDAAIQLMPAGELTLLQNLITSKISTADNKPITITCDEAKKLLAALAQATLAATRPVEIAVHIEGGAVSAINIVEEDPRPVRVYVHDHDLDGHDEEPENDNNIAHIVIPGNEGELAHCRLEVSSGEPVSSAGLFWTKLRDEALRLEE